jgi:hypothetical protein
LVQNVFVLIVIFFVGVPIIVSERDLLMEEQSSFEVDYRYFVARWPRPYAMNLEEKFIFMILDGTTHIIKVHKLKLNTFANFETPAEIDLSELFFGRLKGYVDFFCHFLLLYDHR